MPTPRENLRASRFKVLKFAKHMGIDLTAERQKPGSNARTLANAARRLINTGVPRQDGETMVVDSPPAGAFNSVNTTFVLSGPVLGNNIGITLTHSGVTSSLKRSDNNPPAADEFFFDFNTPTQVVLGIAPDPADMVVATFKRK